jgi:ketosteroid isomerase-like protein
MHTRTTIALLAAVTGFASVEPAAAQARMKSDTALASMVAAERAFSQHSARGGTQAAFLAYLAENSVIYRPRAVKALVYLRARPMPAELLLVWEPVFADIAASGDLGYTTGPWIGSSRSERNSEPSFGEYVTLWRRQADGRWKAELDAGIAHSADPIGPQGLETPSAPAWRSRGRAGNDLASLLAADSALAAAAAANGAGPAFRTRATDHMRLLRTGRFPLQGDSARAFLRATSGYTWKPAAGAVSKAGDLGYTYGPYALLTEPGGRQATETGDYLRIWRRAGNGEWQVALDLTSPAQ